MFEVLKIIGWMVLCAFGIAVFVVVFGCVILMIWALYELFKDDEISESDCFHDHIIYVDADPEKPFMCTKCGKLF